MVDEGAPPSEEDIKSAVLDILQSADLDNTTESSVRKLASQRLRIDLSAHKKLVRRVVEDYLTAKANEGEEESRQHPHAEEEAGDSAAPARGDGGGAGEDEGEEEEEEEEERGAKPSRKERKMSIKETKRPRGDDGEQLICQLSNKRNVSIQKFRGRTLVSIREYYEKDGELRPSAKGISLSVDQWKVFKDNVSAIEKAISTMQE